MNVTFILDGSAGELDRQSVHVSDPTKIADALIDMLQGPEGWMLAIDDTIRVVDLEAP